MKKVLRGRVWRFEGILDVDREICSLKHAGPFGPGVNMTFEERMRELGPHCLTLVDPDFPNKVRPGDLVVGGEGFGYGHDHEHACISLRGAGVGAVLCEAANTNFKRNSINLGLPVIEVKGIMSETKTGDELEVTLAEGRVRNLTTEKTLTFIPYPDFILEIIEAGGVYPQLTNQVKNGVYK